MGSSLETITPLCTHVTRSVASGFSSVPFARRAFPKQNYRAIFRLTTVEKAMLNNDLRCCMPLPPPPPFVDIPRIYGVVAGMSVAKPVYRKTAAVVVRNNYCSGRRAITYPFTRSVLCPDRKFPWNTAHRITNIGIRFSRRR